MIEGVRENKSVFGKSFWITLTAMLGLVGLVYFNSPAESQEVQCYTPEISITKMEEQGAVLEYTLEGETLETFKDILVEDNPEYDREKLQFDVLQFYNVTGLEQYLYVLVFENNDTDINCYVMEFPVDKEVTNGQLERAGVELNV